MSEAVVLCPSCGASVAVSSRFCPSCGAVQQAGDPPTGVQTPEGVAPPPPARSSRQATEFLELLRGYSQLPGVKTAALAALIGAAIVLIFGFLLAALIPADSFIDLSDEGESDLLRETLTHAATTTMATLGLRFEDGSFSLRTAPLLFVLVPLGGCAFGSYITSRRISDLPAGLRYAWGIAVALPFASLMLTISLLAGSDSDSGASSSVSEGSVFLLALLWGALGGLLGVALARGREASADEPLDPNSPLGRALVTLRGTLRPLAVSFLIMAAIGTAIWVVQSARDSSEARGDRSAAVAVMDDFLYSADLGLRYQALGSAAEFQMFGSDFLAAVFTFAASDEGGDETTAAQFLPIPLSQSHLSGELIGVEEQDDSDVVESSFRIFNYGDALPAYFFAPLLLVLILVPVFFALYAGFASARANGALTPLNGALYGALVGPVWAVVMALLNTLTQDLVLGQIVGDSLFIATLLIGATFGALGGLGATLGRAEQGTVSG